MLGVKLEDQQALDRAAETLSVPGLAFAEHGPRDLASPTATSKAADPPLPPEVVAAGEMVLELTKERGCSSSTTCYRRMWRARSTAA